MKHTMMYNELGAISNTIYQYENYKKPFNLLLLNNTWYIFKNNY